MGISTRSTHVNFYDRAGVKTDPFILLKDLHINTIRVRVWVNPPAGYNNGADVLAKAKRAEAQGQRIMIDFHYSDGWADPGKQNKPAAWTSHSLAQLETDVAQHTSTTLTLLKNNGITVDWVQVGNEINGGMLWPDGNSNNFPNLIRLINSGYRASKTVYPNAVVIVHLANGYKNADFRWFFDNMRTGGGQWDAIGMSHYPAVSTWSTFNTQIHDNMVDMVARYNKPVMVCEVGMDWQQAPTANKMLSDLLNKTKSIGPNGLGVFYWEPQAYPGWQGYNMGAMDATGKFTVAMDAF
jgi:arabinogalactan endo-1,4-beta-galactosidase